MRKTKREKLAEAIEKFNALDQDQKQKVLAPIMKQVALSTAIFFMPFIPDFSIKQLDKLNKQ